MWQTVELREVRVFLILAEELHFGRTAEALGLTQSRISQSLRSLEQKLGRELVHRSSRHVELTVAGERFRDEVSVGYRELTGALQRASALSEAASSGSEGSRQPPSRGAVSADSPGARD